MGFHHYLLKIPDYQMSGFRELSERTGESMATWMRRLLDRALQPDVLDEVAPSLSGQIRIDGGRG